LSPEVNLLPIWGAQRQLFGGDPSYLASAPIESLVQLNKVVAEQSTKLDNLEQEQANLRDRLEAQEKVVKDADAELESILVFLTIGHRGVL
jgi:septal ring factor EnvC (AmiA/AmiB activator)